jgi:hypothetical protein
MLKLIIIHLKWPRRNLIMPPNVSGIRKTVSASELTGKKKEDKHKKMRWWS